jgi:hypothetical protein
VNIIADLTIIFQGMGLPVETGVFGDEAPNEYVVITPLGDSFQLYGDNRPGYETQEVRLSVYSKGTYLELKSKIVSALLDGEFTITARRYVGHEDDTQYHHYAIDTEKLYPI